jgi:hypothetical protein
MKKIKGLVIGCTIFLNLFLGTAMAAKSHFAVPGASIIDPFKHSLVFTENFNTADPANHARLKSWLLFGSEGHWDGHLDRSIYHLTNSAAPNEANYLMTTFDDRNLSIRIAEVKVKNDLRQGTGHSGAGLIYSSSLSGDILHAFILQGNGRYTFLKKDQSGFQVLQAGGNAAAQPYVFNSLAVKARSGNKVDLFINGNQVDTINNPGVGFQGGRIGLIAVSTGYFSFGTLTVAAPSNAFGPSGVFDRYETNTPRSFAFPQFSNQKPGPPPKPEQTPHQKPPGPGQQTSAPGITITAADVNMAQTIIKKNTMTVPGMAIGSSIKMGPGDFSAGDALVIYMIKFHHQNKICPPVSVVAEALQKLHDTNYAKKAVVVFWKDYSSASGTSSLSEGFDWYINTKATEKHKINNARLQGYVGAGEAWQKAMNSQRSSWKKSTQRQDEYILKRGAYRAILNAQAAVDAAERAIR